MRSVLSEVVKRGTLALQAEDCLVRAAVHHRGETGGVTRLKNERYYQFIIWRAILPVWHAVVESEDNRDLIIQNEISFHYFEMKKWFSNKGLTEICGMKRDVDRLRQHEHGYLLVMSANNPAQTAKNVSDLAVEVGGLRVDSVEKAGFSTEDASGAEIEFWLAGWQVEKGIAT